MKRITRFKKRTWVLLGIVAVIAAMASVGAYAYWTTGGSGSGSATTGNTTDNIALVGPSGSGDISVGANISPGNSVPVQFKVQNPNAYDVYVNNVFAFSISVTNSGTGPGQCDPSWFHFDGDTGTSGNQANYAFAATQAASTTSATQSAALAMDESGTNQDGCKAQTVTLVLHSN
jgi:hypothetical protein